MRLSGRTAEERRALRKVGYGIPADAVRDERSGDDGEAFTFGRAGALYAIVFRGSAGKCEWYYRFRDEASRSERIRMFFKSIEEWKARKAKDKAERAAAPRGMDVGDVLRSTWGYDQTNVDYYEVTKLVGNKNMVEIRPICAESKEDVGWMRGTCVPVPGKYKGEPMLKVARNGSVSLTSYSSASKIKPIAEVAGKRLYATDNWTAYA